MQEIRADGRERNLEDLKKMIRGKAKEKNDPVFGSLVDPAKDVQNKVKLKNKLPVPKKTDSFAGSTAFPDGSVQVYVKVVQAKILPHDQTRGLNASFAMVVTSLKNVNSFQPNQVRKS